MRMNLLNFNKKWVVVILCILLIILILKCWLLNVKLKKTVEYLDRQDQIAHLPNYEPNSLNEFITTIIPMLDITNKLTQRVRSQYFWSRNSLDKCIRTIEIEKGLEPIPLSTRDFPLFETDTNNTYKYHLEGEPLYIPYESPELSTLKYMDDMRKLRACLNLNAMALSMCMQDANDRIENLEKRLKRLEAPLDIDLSNNKEK